MWRKVCGVGGGEGKGEGLGDHGKQMKMALWVCEGDSGMVGWKRVVMAARVCVGGIEGR